MKFKLFDCDSFSRTFQLMNSSYSVCDWSIKLLIFIFFFGFVVGDCPVLIYCYYSIVFIALCILNYIIYFTETGYGILFLNLIEMKNIDIQNIQESDEPLQDPDYEKILENQDFFPKIFLQPSEIRLHKNSGLMVINRNKNSPDKYTEEQVLPIAFDQGAIRDFQSDNTHTIQNPAGHGLLSLFKRTKYRRPKLAICVCVYSQPKHMLKATIKGIQQSYQHFFKKAGILPHQIILVVIFDGIQKVNADKDQTANMISFFNEIDIMNGFTHKPYGKSLDQYLKDLEKNKFQLDEFLDDQVNLFTEDQLNQLKPKLFQNQYNQYVRIKKLQKEIAVLKKQKKIRIDSMPHDVYKKYEELSLNFCHQNNIFYQTQEQIQQYLSSKKNIRLKLIYQALHDTENLCKNYLESRQRTSILYPVRLESNSLKNPRSMLGEQDASKKGDPQKEKQYNYVFFCVKHKNQGKLSSHLLFFEGFCKLFDPEYCILTDVGVKPSKDSIYKMWAHMQKTPKCGGVCGYMGLKLQNPADDMGYRNDGYDDNEVDCCTRAFDCFFSVQRAQQFQYHFAHMIDKPFEAAFGYIHVLPGAFSGYRWKTLKSIKYKEHQKQSVEGASGIQTQRNILKRNEEQDYDQQALMSKYLKTAHNQNLKITMQEANMYLAEDRVLCLGIHALGYDLHYLPDAQSTVDPVTSLTRLLGQRRRWINGSWFAFNYVRDNWNQGKNILFYLQILYYSLNQKITWISLALFYVTMNLTLIATVNQYVVPLIERFFSAQKDYQLYNYRIWIFNVKSMIESIPDAINFIFILMMFSIILYSTLLNHNNSGFKRIYYFVSSVLGIYGLCVFGILVVNVYQIIFETVQGKSVQDFIIPIIYLRIMIFFIIGGHAIPILWTFSIRKYIEMIVSLLSYIFYAPTYLNILLTFAFCRIDDLSWGTKGLDNESSSVSRDWQRRKYIFILQYISTNCVVAYVLVKLSDYDFPRNIIILSSAILVVFLLAFRLFFATIYLVKYYIKKIFFMNFSAEYINQNRAQGQRVFKALRLIQQRIKEIQKKETKKKKQEEFHRLKSVTSQILANSTTLSHIGNKLRSKVAQHLVSNNIFSKKQLLDPKRRLRPRKKINIRKKLNTVEQMSHQDSQQSRANFNQSHNFKDGDKKFNDSNSNNNDYSNQDKSDAFKKVKDSSSKKNVQEGETTQKQHFEILVPEVSDKKQNIRARIQEMRKKREKRQPGKRYQKQ